MQCGTSFGARRCLIVVPFIGINAVVVGRAVGTLSFGGTSGAIVVFFFVFVFICIVFS